MQKLVGFTECPKCKSNKAFVNIDVHLYDYNARYYVKCDCGYSGYCWKDAILYRYIEE